MRFRSRGSPGGSGPAALLSILLLAAAGGCDGNPDSAAARGPSDLEALAVRNVTPTRRDVLRTITLPASVRADLEVTLYAKVTGYLKEITKDRGDKVKAGELIATLEIPEMVSEIAHARASFALEDATSSRLEAIRKVEKSAVTDQDLDLARAKRDMAGATLKKLETLQAYTEIRAPFTGAVTERFVDPGAFIQQGKIVSLVDISKVRVLVDIPEPEVRFAVVGTAARVSFDALPGKDIHAAISRTAGSLDPMLRTMRVEVDVPNPEYSIFPGMFARVALALERHPRALVVPLKAVTLHQDKSFVFVESEGKAKKLPVTLGTEDGQSWELLSGLSGTETLLVSEGKPLTEGMPVRVIAPPEGTASRPPEGGSK